MVIIIQSITVHKCNLRMYSNMLVQENINLYFIIYTIQTVSVIDFKIYFNIEV